MIARIILTTRGAPDGQHWEDFYDDILSRQDSANELTERSGQIYSDRQAKAVVRG
jgi:hypothetical protein